MVAKASSVKALSDIKVVELGEFVSAPHCGRVLADMGAEVIKVEKPFSGDKARSHGPFPNDEPDLEKSGLFLVLNTNKKGITLDVKQARGRKILKELLKDADILVENNSPRLMKELGLDFASLSAEFPKLIMVSITPWGTTGPWKDFKGDDLCVSAVSGICTMFGNPNREPQGHAMSFGDYAAGQSGATSSMYALFDRDKTGKGRHCDIASFQIMTSYYAVGGLDVWRLQHQAGLRCGAHNSTYFYPSMVMPCKDGYFTMFTFEFNHWKRLMEIIGNPEWSKDPRFNFKPEEESMGVFMLAPHLDELDALLSAELEKFTKMELFDACLKAKIPFLPVMTIEDMMKNPQTKFRNEIIEMEHPVAGKLKYPGAPAILPKTPWKLETPAPLLGQHNDEIYCGRQGYKKEDLAELRRAGII